MNPDSSNTTTYRVFCTHFNSDEIHPLSALFLVRQRVYVSNPALTIHSVSYSLN